MKKFIISFCFVLLSAFIFLPVYMYFIEPNMLVVKKEKTFSSLGLRVVVFSDTHFGKFYSYKNADKIVEKINAQQADIVLFLGDMFDDINKEQAQYLTNKFMTIKAPYGKYAINGNHDFRIDVRLYNKIMTDAGFHVLVNNMEKLSDYNINILGIDDAIKGNIDTTFFKNITDTESLNILLLHEPDIIDYIDTSKIDIAFAGHTHGGQVKVPFLTKLVMPPYAKKYTDGLYNVNDNTKLYVSTGIGMSGLPIRFMNIPEILVFD